MQDSFALSSDFLEGLLICWRNQKRGNYEDQPCQLLIRIALDRSNIYLLKFSRHFYRARCDRLPWSMQKIKVNTFHFSVASHLMKADPVNFVLF